MDSLQPPELADGIFGGLRVCMTLKALLCSGDDELPQHWNILRAIHTLNSPQNCIRLFGGLLPIHTLHWRGAQGLMWGTRGPYLPAVVMVGYGCVGRCWQLEANSDQPTVGIVKIVYGSIFFIPTYIPYNLDI